MYRFILGSSENILCTVDLLLIIMSQGIVLSILKVKEMFTLELFMVLRMKEEDNSRLRKDA